MFNFPQDDSMMSEWSEAAIDNIIDNLQPEKVAKVIFCSTKDVENLV